MELNADFSVLAAAHARGREWIPSPMPGVERWMLDRIGGEVARATSIVRYAAQSRFSAHTHTGGEEFLVLEGVFSDETGDYGPGSYVRNPPGTQHAPRSEPGCTIFVKLWQFDLEDQEPVAVDTAKLHFVRSEDRTHVETKELFARPDERVRIERWAPHSAIPLRSRNGFEALVLSGGFALDESFARHSWLRVPPGVEVVAKTDPTGALLWIKEGHLGAPVERFRAALSASGTRLAEDRS